MALGTATADALIACWRSKYDENYWRPITATREADTDGNPATAPDPGWTPLLATPPYPDYPSGHACITGAATGVLSHLFGARSLDLELASGVTGTTRQYDSAAALDRDSINARIWLGLHFRHQGRSRLTAEGLYGRRKMTAHLRRTSLPETSTGAVDRAMRLLGLSGVRRDKGHRTTIPAKDGKRAGDLLNRDFTAAAPNRVWVADFTYCRTWAGFVYVAFIVDVFAQRIVAWHASTSKLTELVMTPLRMALWQAGRDGHPAVHGQLICHSDAGSQYTSIRFTEHLELEGLRPSIGTVGDAYDNALMETVIGLFKTECIRTTVFHSGPYKTLADVEFATAGWVDWYNHRRLHSSLGMIPPIEYEQAHYAALNAEEQPV